MLDAGSATEWEGWLDANHGSSTEVWLRLFNKSRTSDVPLTYEEAVEIALCFGWIDSLARGYDATSRIQRFSPRKPRSGWSRSNVARVQRLLEAGRPDPIPLVPDMRARRVGWGRIDDEGGCSWRHPTSTP